MFTNLCLALLLQLAGLFVLKFHFRKIEKAKEKSWKSLSNLADGVTALAQLCFVL